MILDLVVLKSVVDHVGDLLVVVDNECLVVAFHHRDVALAVDNLEKNTIINFHISDC